jgi:pimeloyl-ACP methyl ester carboxylesterase
MMRTTRATEQDGTGGIAPTDQRAVTGDGVTLALARYAATVRHRIPVVLTHGLFSNRQVCAPMARYLASEGFDCWVLELRGHGASEKPGPRPDPEHWGAYDVPAALETVRGLTGQATVQLVAHSVGGLAFLMYLARRPERRASVAGLVTLGCHATGMYSTVCSRLAAEGARLGAAVLGYAPGRAWRLGPENEAKSVLDVCLRWSRTRRWVGADGFDYLAALADLRVPTWSLAGAGDHAIAPAAACRQLYDAIGSPWKRWTLCGRAEGFSEDFTHVRLIASRAAQREIWPRIKDWLTSAVVLDD